MLWTMGVAAALNCRKRSPWDLSKMGRNLSKSAIAVESSLGCVSNDDPDEFP